MTLLVTWRVINTWILGFSDFSFAISVFFGTIPVGLWIGALMLVDQRGDKKSFPRDIAPLFVAIIIGIVALVALRAYMGELPPARHDRQYWEKMNWYLSGFTPWIVVAAALLIRRFAKSDFMEVFRR